jgi:predicted N-acetyltransferase YhbS
MTDLSLSLRPEMPSDAETIDKLHARAFGPGRFARTAFRLREGVPHRPELSFVAEVGTLLVGSIRLTPILAGGRKALLLGPLTVEPAFMKRGIGMALLTRAVDAARDHGHALVILVGDVPFYGRIGFRAVPHAKLLMPGPVDPARLLALELISGALEDAKGAVLPDKAAGLADAS